ncbi:MFS transporter [Actinomadura verrucosospora]|uniref:Arabinose efflux permease family protein n=1 Tax=Actinomadura verrucosospora TaxID=46165 RepID=A0A7D4ALV1_ACTVE|nr:MFS transporter [Actinomadura verrucosospora]QKG19889.1 arabinose efflux permease family protein [Actinomadura verrucosospora]
MPKGALWRHPDFLRLWTGQTISNFGDKISLVALPTVAVVVLHGGAFEAGVLGALRFLPYLVFGPFAGMLADKLSKRRTMIWADAGRLAALASIPAAWGMGALTMAHLYVVAALVGVLTVFFEVSYQSYVPALVGRAGLYEANSKLQMSRSSSQVFGSALGGLLMQLLGSALAVLADALSFLLSAISLVLMKHREEAAPAPAGDRPSPGAQLREGLSALFGVRLLRDLMCSSTLGNTGASMGAALVLVFAYHEGGLTPGEVGLAFAVGGAGFIVGAAVATRVAAAVRLGPAITACPVLAGIGYLVVPGLGPSTALVGLAVTQFLVGVAQSMYNIHVMSLVQSVTPQHLLGRVSGGAMTLVMGSMALGSMIGGLLGGVIGVPAALVVSGALLVASSVFLLAGPVVRMAKQPSADDAGQDAREERTDEPEPSVAAAASETP